MDLASSIQRYSPALSTKRYNSAASLDLTPPPLFLINLKTKIKHWLSNMIAQGTRFLVNVLRHHRYKK